jgi:hypothetical protein
LYIILVIADQGILKNIMIPVNSGWGLNTQRQDISEEKADYVVILPLLWICSILTTAIWILPVKPQLTGF